MAVIKPTVTDVSPAGDGSALSVVWTPVTEADTCQQVKYPKHSDKSIQAVIAPAGAFGGATVALNGANSGDGTVAGGSIYSPLNTPASAAIALNAAGIKAVLENTVYVQPVATGGTGQSLTIAMLFHFSNPARQ